MEIQLQELIDQIKKDGVEAAKTQADTILESAKDEAEKIISDAKAKAEKMIADAKAENERVVKSGEDALRQAGRNLLITFRESVAKEINAIVSEKVSTVYSKDELTQLIVKVVEGWAAKPEADNISVILNSNDLENFEKTLIAEFKEKTKIGVTLKANDNFDGGFRISSNNDGAYYDFSKDAVVDMLSNYLSPKITALLKEAE